MKLAISAEAAATLPKVVRSDVVRMFKPRPMHIAIGVARDAV
jgi:hypothetical protein